MNTTNLEQSKKLVELGIAPSTADMCILPFNSEEYRLVPMTDIAVRETDDKIPAWSLAALMNVIPQSIITDYGDEYTVRISKYKDFACTAYTFGYEDTFTNTMVIEFVSEEVLEAAFEMIVWLKENKYI